MKGANERPTVVVDTYTRCCLTAIAVLLTVLVIGLWATGPAGPAPSSAAPPRSADSDSGGIGNPNALRMATLNAIGTTNQKLDKIISLIESGKIKVVLADAGAKNAPAEDKRPAGR